MKKSIILLVILPVIGLAGCAGLVPPIETDPNAVTLIFKTGEKVEGCILDIQGDLIRFEPDKWGHFREDSHIGKFTRAEEVRFIQLPNGSRFTVKDYIAYRWKPQSPAPLLGNGAAKTAQKEAAQANTGQDLQYEQLKKKAVAEMTPNEFGYFMLMKQQEIKAQPRPVGAFEQEKRAQPTQANTMAVKTDSGKVAPRTFSLTPRADSKISKEEEVIKEIAGFLVEAELAGPFIKAAQQKKEQGDFLTLNQLWLVNEVTKTPVWKKRQDDLRNLSVEAEQAVAHVYLYAPDSLSQRLGLRFDPNAEMDFRDLMEQLHQRFGATVTMGDFRLLIAIFEEDGARAIREILNHYTDWRFAIENKHPLATKNLRD